ncbi:hypothetical protein AB0G67_46660 [Streptomyces sp. NPDC021056]|uniref:hypothetical protein n=1 Tax=Streptomyces sp. NPDC021056 TaxID=3155012 RepID=UPI0033DDB425
MLCSIVLAVGGVALLAAPPAPTSPSSTPTTTPTSTPTPTAAPYVTTGPSTAVSEPAVNNQTTDAAPSIPLAVSPSPFGHSALAPHGEGVAGDGAVQQSLEAAWPADLPAADERELLAAGRALLRADATGVGRETWPQVFPRSAAVAPAFALARFRNQAAIARREGRAEGAVVHLVWAGMDRGGTFTDLRVTDWHFTRTVKEGASAWIPQPRT